MDDTQIHAARHHHIIMIPDMLREIIMLDKLAA